MPTFLNGTIYCSPCLKEGVYSGKAYMSKAKFVRRGIDVFRKQVEIVKTITVENPEFSVTTYKNSDSSVYLVLSIYFVFWKPNEIESGHEGASVIFDFRKLNNKLKLFQISTVSLKRLHTTTKTSSRASPEQ